MNVYTLAMTERQANNWISVQVPPASTIGYVAIYNRQDGKKLSNLGAFEIWVGQSFGDTSSESASKCGEAVYIASHEPNPYVLWCSGRSAKYVTVKQTGSKRFLVIGDINVYEAVGDAI